MKHHHNKTPIYHLSTKSSYLTPKQTQVWQREYSLPWMVLCTFIDPSVNTFSFFHPYTSLLSSNDRGGETGRGAGGVHGLSPNIFQTNLKYCFKNIQKSPCYKDMKNVLILLTINTGWQLNWPSLNHPKNWKTDTYYPATGFSYLIV